MYGLIDQIADKELTKLSNMLEKFLPAEVLSSDINPIEDLLPALMSKGSPGHMIIMSMTPKEEEKVIDLPGGGKMIMKRMRSGHSAFMENEPEFGMRKLLENKGECALGDKFPMSDPFQAMLSLLYAHGQKEQLPPGSMEDVIEPKAAEVAGSKLVEDVRNFIESVGKGTKEFMDTEEGKKIIVSVEDYSDAAKNIDKEEDIEAKEASWIALDNPMRVNEIKKHLKATRQVQTSLPKLAFTLDVYQHFGHEVRGFINSLKYSMRNDGYITVGDKTAQQQIFEKLSEILKNKGVEDTNLIEDLVYNTDIPNAEGEIIQVAGYPIDVEKLNNLSYDEAEKALTGSIAKIIFNEDKSAVDVDKFKDFLENLLANQDSDSEREEVEDRIVDPILTTFEKESKFVEGLDGMIDPGDIYEGLGPEQKANLQALLEKFKKDNNYMLLLKDMGEDSAYKNTLYTMPYPIQEYEKQNSPAEKKAFLKELIKSATIGIKIEIEEDPDGKPKVKAGTDEDEGAKVQPTKNEGNKMEAVADDKPKVESKTEDVEKKQKEERKKEVEEKKKEKKEKKEEKKKDTVEVKKETPKKEDKKEDKKKKDEEKKQKQDDKKKKQEEKAQTRDERRQEREERRKEKKEKIQEEKKEKMMQPHKPVEHNILDVNPRHLMEDATSDIEDDLANPKLGQALLEGLLEAFAPDMDLLKRAGLDNEDLI